MDSLLGGLGVETGGKKVVFVARRGHPLDKAGLLPFLVGSAGLGVGHGVDVGAHHPNLIVFFVQVVQQDVAQ